MEVDEETSESVDRRSSRSRTAAAVAAAAAAAASVAAASRGFGASSSSARREVDDDYAEYDAAPDGNGAEADGGDAGDNENDDRRRQQQQQQHEQRATGAGAAGGEEGQSSLVDLADLDPRAFDLRSGLVVGNGDAVTFQEGEDVLAYFKNELFKARVLRVSTDDSGERRYYVHYHRWSRRWDDWLPSSDLAKFSEKALQARQEWRERREQSKGADRKRKSPSSAVAGQGSSKKRKSSLSTATTAAAAAAAATVALGEADVPHTGLDIKLPIPANLKNRLVRDWEEVVKHHRLVQLPADYSVRRILHEYLDSRGKSPKSDTVLNDCVNGLLMYFDRALPSALLYRFERPQLRFLKADKSSGFQPSEVYGAEHLLRLFVKLPSMLSHHPMVASQQTLLQKHLTDFLRWLGRSKNYFRADYVDPEDPAAYLDAFNKSD